MRTSPGANSLATALELTVKQPATIAHVIRRHLIGEALGPRWARAALPSGWSDSLRFIPPSCTPARPTGFHEDARAQGWLEPGLAERRAARTSPSARATQGA